MGKSLKKTLTFIFITVILALTVNNFCWADIYGKIQGTVSDDKGAPLPGATVSVESPALMRKDVSVITDSRGKYRIDVLPAGVYEVKISLQGFTTQVKRGIKLNLNETATVNVSLTMATVQESVTVVADAPIIDVTRSSISQTIETKDIATLPIRDRDFTRLIQLQPAVVPTETAWKGYEQSVLGGRKHNSGWLIDGIENSNEQGYGVRGYEHNFDLDVFEEYELILTGYNAEYGRASAGVTKIITKSGGNEFHGSASVYHKSDSLASSIEDIEVPEFKRWIFSVNLGGYLIKDNTWFFLSYQRLNEDTGVYWDVDAIPDSIKAGEDFSIVPKVAENIYFLKLSQRLSDHDKLVFTINYDPRDEKNQWMGGSTLPSAGTTMSSGGILVYATYTHIFSANAFIDVAAQYNQGGFTAVMDLADVGQYFPSYDKGFSYGNNTNLDEDRRQIKADLTLFKEDMMGDHEFKLGLDYNYVHMGGGPSREWLPEYYYLVDDANAQPNLKHEYGGILTSNVSVKNYAFYVQDSWSVSPYVTFNLGLRYDYANLVKKEGVNDKNDFAPRIGITWDLTQDQKTLLRAHWGIFYDQVWLNELLNNPEFGGRTIINNIYRWTGTEWEFMYASGSIRVMEEPFTTPYHMGFNIGIQREILPDLSFEIQYINRKAKNLMDKFINNWKPDNSGVTTDGGPPVSEVGFLGKSDYWGVSFQVTKRFSHNFSLNAAYTYSQCKDLKSSTYAYFDNDNDPDKDYSWADHDARHVFYTNGVFILPYGIEFGLIIQARTGMPYTGSGGTDIDNDGRLERPFIDGVQIERNSYRFPDYFRVDLSAKKAFQIAQVRLVAMVDFFNVLNKANVSSVVRNVFSDSFGEAQSWFPGREIRLGFKMEF